MLRKNSSARNQAPKGHLGKRHILAQSQADSYRPRRHGVTSPKQEKASVTVAVLKSICLMPL